MRTALPALLRVAPASAGTLTGATRLIDSDTVEIAGKGFKSFVDK